MKDSPPQQEVKEHILRHGWNSTCWQVLNKGLNIWWSEDREALVGYVISGRLAISAGAPICSENILPQTIIDWETFLEKEGLTACYFGAESRLQAILENTPGSCFASMGSQPEWNSGGFVKSFCTSASLRAQISRAANKGVTVSEWTWDRAEGSQALREVLNEWLETRGLPTLHFLVDPDTLCDLEGRRIFVAELHGSPVGFVTLCPIPSRNGWLTEQFVRGRNAPNGTVEMMLHQAALTSESSEGGFWTMGIVPLVESERLVASHEPFWLTVIKKWAKAHYIRFYNFRGLHEFKRKFRPESWQPVVVIVRDNKIKLSHLRSIAQAFTTIPPEVALLIGLLKSVKWEVQKLPFIRLGRK